MKRLMILCTLYPSIVIPGHCFSHMRDTSEKIILIQAYLRRTSDDHEMSSDFNRYTRQMSYMSMPTQTEAFSAENRITLESVNLTAEKKLAVRYCVRLGKDNSSIIEKSIELELGETAGREDINNQMYAEISAKKVSLDEAEYLLEHHNKK